MAGISIKTVHKNFKTVCGNVKASASKLLDVKPRRESDYLPFLGWLVSRKLAVAFVVVIGIFSACLLWSLKPKKPQEDNAYKAYKYDSFALRLADGKVAILAKSGYTAYVGDVEGGVVKGQGTLYGKDGNTIYEGAFDVNAYNGDGTLYYPSGQPAYEGTFRDNAYDGEGKLYREDGTLKYEGDFLCGSMSGAGTLYDAAQQAVYTGHFRNDRILYQELLGKKSAEVAQMYTGRREVYTGDAVYCVYLRDIGAVYSGEDGSNSLDEAFLVSGVYVLQQDILLEGEIVHKIPDLQRILGTPIYQGNTLLEPKDMVALNKTCDLVGENTLYGRAAYREDAVFDDVTELSDFPKDYQAYIYVYEKDGLVYTFFCKDKDNGFDFYFIEV